VLLWGQALLAQLDAAVEASRAGRPTALIVEGDAGNGKSALLDELAQRASDFTVRRADCAEADRAPLGVLTQWGVQVPRPDDGSQPAGLAATQALREQADALALAGPVLLIIDDLQWADPESLAALSWLLRRAVGDRLLVAATTRPDGPGWIPGLPDPVHLTLTGLSQADVTTLVRQRWPDASAEVTGRLWEHTGGNPLYLQALLTENDPQDLAAARVLPAPVEFARNLGLRVSALSDPAVALLRAVAVLGSGWVSLLDAAAVGEAGEAFSVAQELADAGLARIRAGDGPVSVTMTHDLARSAVYQQTPLPGRRDLHRRAAQVVTDPHTVFTHRVAAADQYDEALAQALESAAAGLYDQRSFRQAAQYLRWASALTAKPAERERRWLESLYDSVMAYDFAAVHQAADDVGRAGHAALRALVLGGLAAWERRRRYAITILEPAAAALSAADDRRTRYRIEVLLAFCQVTSGNPTETVAASLARVQSAHVRDAGLGGIHMLTVATIAIRQRGTAAVAESLAALPANPAAVPLAATDQLGWRGMLQARTGFTGEAVADLTEFARRVEAGVSRFGAGTMHAFLGFAYWLRGDWSLARVTFRLASELGGEQIHPMAAALVPLADIGEGRFDAADEAMERAADLLDGPWPEILDLLAMVCVIRAHAGSAEDRARLAPLIGRPATEVGGRPGHSQTMLLHLVQAHIWIRDLAGARAGVEELVAMARQPTWLGAAVHWLSGLIHEASGAHSQALAELTAAVRADASELPLYRAHMLADHARLARSGRDAEESLREAEQIYRRLGAVPYLARLATVPDAGSGPEPRSVAAGPSPLPPAFAVTEREHDVLTLLLSGMSYAQISRELFITQSTVGYHLGNLYAKAGVTTRHQLAELARAHPGPFGITVANA
jgi:DNA-binding CsgD family transcriptional regulator